MKKAAPARGSFNICRQPKSWQAIGPGARFGSKFVGGKEVPAYFYTRHPNNYKRKLTAPTEDELYKKLFDIYTGKGFDITGQTNSQESINSLRNIFKKYIKSAGEISSRSIEERQRIWDIYLDETELAAKDIHDITVSDIMITYRNILTAGTKKDGKKFTAKYFNAISGCVHAIYKYATTFEQMSVTDLPKSLDLSMFSQFLRSSKAKNDDIKAKALTRKQLKRAFEWCESHSDDLPVLALWLNFHVALRFAELYALRWCDIDIINEYIYVRGQMDKPGHTRQNHTKKDTEEGIRDIPLTPEAIRICTKIIELKPKDANDDDIIFPIGGYSTYSRRCHECFAYALSKKNAPTHYVTHSVRATTASIWYDSGELDIKEIQSNLGHKQSTMTSRYCHDLSDGDKKKKENGKSAGCLTTRFYYHFCVKKSRKINDLPLFTTYFWMVIQKEKPQKC